MDFLLNNLSLAGQFHDLLTFQIAVDTVMAIRQEIDRLGSSLYCHRSLVNALVGPNCVMQQAVRVFPRDKQLAWVRWLNTHGPFWDDLRQHDADDWIEVNGEPVTDSAVGEAAFCCIQGLPRELVSFNPSDWLFSPVNATWRRDDSPDEAASIPNHWELGTVQKSLAANPPAIDSWVALNTFCRRAYTRLLIAGDAFHPLRGHPFVPAAADQIRVLLNVLNELKGCFDEEGKWTSRGLSLYNTYFVGKAPRFTDSSDPEKNQLRKQLTFPHPEKPGQHLFCPWHGKVRVNVIRIHFSWPIEADGPLYVVYVGPHITKP